MSGTVDLYDPSGANRKPLKPVSLYGKSAGGLWLPLQVDSNGSLGVSGGTVDEFGSEQVIIYDAAGSPVTYTVDAQGRSLVRASGYAFDVPVVAACSTFATPYTAGDIMGALLTFAAVAPWATAPIMVTGAQVSFAVAVAPNPLSLILFNADPTATTKTDNAAYSLNAADFGAVIKSINFQGLGAVYTDHGTPNTISVDNLGVVCVPAATSLYGLLIDGTGVTLSAATNVQVRLRGFAI